MPNHYHFALMSSYIYEHSPSAVSDKLTTLRHNGWNISADSQSTGIGLNENYLGVAFYHATNRELVIVNRGTILYGGLGNMLENIAIAENRNVGTIVNPAWLFLTTVLGAMPGVRKVYQTGHSLGGFIAQVNAARLTSDRLDIESYAVTYDAPGAMTYMQSAGIRSNGKRTFNYLSAPNLVNTCHIHDGIRRRIYTSVSSIPCPLDREINFIPNFKYDALVEAVQTYHSHSMEELLAAFNPQTGLPNESAFIARWPLSENRFFRSRTPPNICYDLNAIPSAGVIFPLIGIIAECFKNAFIGTAYVVSSLNSNEGGIVSWSHTRHGEEQEVSDKTYYTYIMVTVILIAVCLTIQQAVAQPNFTPHNNFN